ncbi:CGNR zinc finger domain-containing protein [Nocardiopsis potens]|uniref:CGNR zinc finger domain-containing protein n=1 Tax=Nocardiopsis potens TaxID=1246458 RepID=UPI0003449A15|nr:CGNR zinc finger domain-containing protein [Nocardiopsis potens]
MPDGVTGLLAGRSVRAVAERTADLVNLLAGAEEPPLEAVAETLRAHGETDPLDLAPADLPALADAARRLRTALLADDLAEASRRVNALLAEAAHPPRLTDHHGTAHWHLHIDARDDAPWADWLLTSGALAIAQLIADRQRLPGGRCAAPGCPRVFLASGAAPRRFCSPRCATRTRVAAHRRRR